MKFANYLMFKMFRRYGPGEDPETLYKMSYEKLTTLPPPWGLQGVDQIKLKDYTGEVGVGVKYPKIDQPSPIKGFYFGYFNRARTAVPPDESMYDDTFTIEFYPKKVAENWRYLMDVVFPTYISATQPYCGSLCDAEINVDDVFVFDEQAGTANRRAEYLDDRMGIRRVWQANYWDRELCMRSFKLSPEEIATRLDGKVATCRVFEDGVLLIYSYSPLLGPAILEINAAVMPLLIK